MARWHFGLAASAIQDGTCTDLFRGQQLQFSVTFTLESWERASETPEVAAVRVEASRYDLVARVDAVGANGWVLDCGLLVGCPDPPPAGLEVGHRVTGGAGLSISAEELQIDGVGPLLRTWFVERVHHRTEPDDLGFADLGMADLGLHGGPEEPGWEELAFTDAWGDDEGRAEYLVECLAVDA